MYKFRVLSEAYAPVEVQGDNLAELGRAYMGFPFDMAHWLVDVKKGEIYSLWHAQQRNLNGLPTLGEVVSR